MNTFHLINYAMICSINLNESTCVPTIECLKSVNLYSNELLDFRKLITMKKFIFQEVNE